MNTEKVKIGLLGLIAFTLLVNTYFIATKNSTPRYERPDTSEVKLNSVSNVPTGNNQPATNQLNPNNNPNINSLPSVTAPAGPTTAIKFAQDVKDFGKVVAQSTNSYSFEFVNTGNEPLTIENAKGSCGCTVPDWPKEPIMPGETGLIDVVFTPKPTTEAKEDKKTITITANTNPKQTMLTVKAFVSPAPGL